MSEKTKTRKYYWITNTQLNYLTNLEHKQSRENLAKEIKKLQEKKGEKQ